LLFIKMRWLLSRSLPLLLMVVHGLMILKIEVKQLMFQVFYVKKRIVAANACLEGNKNLLAGLLKNVQKRSSMRYPLYSKLPRNWTKSYKHWMSVLFLQLLCATKLKR
jgi:hypothetical protein